LRRIDWNLEHLLCSEYFRIDPLSSLLSRTHGGTWMHEQLHDSFSTVLSKFASFLAEICTQPNQAGRQSDNQISQIDAALSASSQGASAVVSMHGHFV
jgi:hypothetical protein